MHHGTPVCGSAAGGRVHPSAHTGPATGYPTRRAWRVCPRPCYMPRANIHITAPAALPLRRLRPHARPGLAAGRARDGHAPDGTCAAAPRAPWRSGSAAGRPRPPPAARGAAQRHQEPCCCPRQGPSPVQMKTAAAGPADEPYWPPARRAPCARAATPARGALSVGAGALEKPERAAAPPHFLRERLAARWVCGCICCHSANSLCRGRGGNHQPSNSWRFDARNLPDLRCGRRQNMPGERVPHHAFGGPP